MLTSLLLAILATPVQQAEPEAKVCRRQQAPVGSRLGTKKVCRTAAEWDEIDRQAQRDRDQEGPIRRQN